MLGVQQLMGIITSIYTQVYTENIPAPSFLRSFFPTKTYRTATINLEVSRGTETIAADVLRGTRGNRNTFSKWSGKEYLPPFFKEFFDATNLDNYDRVMGQAPDGTTKQQAGVLARDVGMKYVELRNKIERAKELQSSQVFETGIVTMKNGDNIDYKRKATSMINVNTAGDYWSVVTANIEQDLINGAEFIRQEGKNGVPEFNLIMSGEAFISFKASNYFKDNANYRNVQLIDINTPQTTAFGAAYHGTIVAGAYVFNIWTYDEGYETDSLVYTKYWPTEKAVIVPVKGSRFEMAHATVPAILKANGREFVGRTAAEYYRYDVLDKNAMAHYFNIMSAPVALPVSIDMIYTMQVLAP